MLARMWNKGNTHPFLVVVQTCRATMKISVVVPQGTGIWSTTRSSLPLLGIALASFISSWHKPESLGRSKLAGRGWCITLIPAFYGRGRQTSEFESSLHYRESSRAEKLHKETRYHQGSCRCPWYMWAVLQQGHVDVSNLCSHLRSCWYSWSCIRGLCWYL